MRQKKTVIILILSFVILFEGSYLTEAFASNNTADTFFRANKEYNAGQKAMAERKKEEAAGKFEQAVSLYEQLLKSGFINGQIYYNLGNAYYRLGMPGKAIIYYRRAEKLLPRDADIKANINLLKRDFVDRETISQKPEILKVACFWYFYLNLERDYCPYNIYLSGAHCFHSLYHLFKVTMVQKDYHYFRVLFSCAGYLSWHKGL